MVKELETTLVDVEKLEDPLLILHPEPNIDYLKELAESIKQVGQMQDITVRKTATGLQLIIGHCRTQAAKTFGISQLRAKIVECTDAEALMMSATENIHKLEQDPIQEAELFLQLMTDHKMTETQIAEKMAKSYNYVRGRLDLLRLTDRVKELVKTKTITIGAATALAKISNPKDQEVVASGFLNQNITVDRAKAVVTAFLEYRKIMAEKPVEQVVQKAMTEPKVKCSICKGLVVISKLRPKMVCEECIDEIAYLRVKEKKETKDKQPTTIIYPPDTSKNFIGEPSPQSTDATTTTHTQSSTTEEKAEGEIPSGA